ncbi:MAG: hypothetical protein WC889_10220 [Myxococcota bacterium]
MKNIGGDQLAENISKIGQPQHGLRSDEGEDRRIAQVEDIFRQMVKGVKTYSIYRHNTGMIESFLSPLFETMDRFLKKNGAIPVKVDSSSLRYLGKEVYNSGADDEINFAYGFYKEGIRKLKFRDGLTSSELLKFVSIATLTGRWASVSSEDMVAALWKASFEHIEYVVVEGIAPLVGRDGSDEEMAQVELEQVTDYVAGSLRAESGDVARSARIIASDLDLVLEDVHGVRGVVDSHVVPQEHRDAIQLEMASEDESVVMSKVLIIMMALVRFEFDDREKEDICESLLIMVDILLLKEDFKSIAGIVRRFDEVLVAQSNGHDFRDRVGYLRERLLDGLVSDARMERVRAIVSSGAIKDSAGFAEYLGMLGEGAQLKLPELMEHAATQENVRVISEAIRAGAARQGEAIARLLSSGKTSVVMEGLQLASGVEFKGRIDSITSLMTHPASSVRVEALRALSAIRPDSARGSVIKALDDGDREVRLAAVSMLHLHDHDWAGELLASIMAGPKFEMYEPDEQRRFMRTAAATSTQRVMELFNTLLCRKPPILRRKAYTPSKLMIIDALRAEPSLAGFKLLQRHVQRDQTEPEVKSACNRAMEDIRTRLVGRRDDGTA